MIPDDRWHEPYMSRHALDGEVAAGVAFWGCETDGSMIGIMGIQFVRDVDLQNDFPSQSGKSLSKSGH